MKSKVRRVSKVGVAKKGKKDKNFHASNWLSARTTPEILIVGSCQGTCHNIIFHENRLRVPVPVTHLIWPSSKKHHHSVVWKKEIFLLLTEKRNC